MLEEHASDRLGISRNYMIEFPDYMIPDSLGSFFYGIDIITVVA